MTSRLSPRELEVMRLRAQGHKMERIADELGIGVQTVKNYCRSAFSKTGSSSVSEFYVALDWLHVPNGPSTNVPIAEDLSTG